MNMMILISLCLTSLLAFLFLKRVLKRVTTTNLKLPPSPWRLPVIGNLHQLSRNPHRSLGSLSLRYGPLMLLHFGRVPVLVVSSADTAHDVMKTQDVKFANRPITKVFEKFLNGGKNLAVSPYGEYWKQVKSICVQNLLSNKTVRSFENIREEEINVMMDKLEKASSSSSITGKSKQTPNGSYE
ncbi:Cytochrome P450 71A20 [Raphanus sativus]|nr:Cytochrome P450 71A20 [Raphanus sativus]